MLRRNALLSLPAFALTIACSKPSESPAEPSQRPLAEPPSAIDTAGAPPSEPEPPTAQPTAADVPQGPPGSAQAVEKPAPEACVKECIARDQMRAEAAEKIEANCRAECR
jgi:hypothetical protein